MTSNPSFNNETSALNVATTYSSRASKKTILITGVSPNSLGEGIARSLAHGGASTIIITGRNNERLAAVTHTLSTDYPSTNFRPLRFDLDNLGSISSAVTELLNDDDIPQIDILVASAGRHYFDAERILTSDGLEMHFAVNYLSTFHLVKSLLPKIKAAAKKNVRGATRIVTVTSGAIRASPIRFSDWNFDGNHLSEDEKPNTELVPFPVGIDDASIKYDHRVAYGQSKTASVLLAVHLNTLFTSEGIFSFSANPGTVATRYAASLQDNFTDEQKAAVARLGTPKTVDQGAATAVVAALDPGLEPESGVYLTHCQVGEAPEWATSKEKAEKLWRLSENIIQKTLNMQG